MRAHEAGALHGNDAAPAWLPYPDDVNALIPGLWSATATRGADGSLHIGGVSVHTIAEQVGTATFVVDEHDFRQRAGAFRDAFAQAFATHAGASTFYAGKAFLCTEVACWIHHEGLGLDVCSGGELAVAERAGFPLDKVAFHGNNKSATEIEHALSAGIGCLVLDSLSEIELVAQIATDLGVRAPVMVRVTTGVEAHTHEFIATAHEDQKFGISLATGEAREAVLRISQAPEAFDFRGIHSHIGSQIFDTSGFEVAIRRVLTFIASLQRADGIAVHTLGLGGGFGVMYTTQHTPASPEQLAQEIAAAVVGECERHQIAVPHVSFEPGRAIAGPSTLTLYTVGTVKTVQLGGNRERLYVSVDGGMSDNIRTALYDADYSCLLAGRTSEAEPVVVRVVGRHCESGDIVVKDEYLPADVRRGDLIAVPVTGAYCYAMASTYNHIPRPAVVAVREGEIRTLLRRETNEDLFLLDVG